MAKPGQEAIASRAPGRRGSLPLVSVVTPVYNGEDYLAQCIQSVLAQTYRHWELLVVDNRSTDRTLEIAQAFAQRDTRIRVSENLEFLTAVQNHNHALRLVSPESKYCKVLHADDWLFPECLARMVELAEENPSVGIVASYRLKDIWVDLDGLPYPSTVVSGREICRATLLSGPYVFGSPTSSLIRADLIRRRTDFYDETIVWADTDVCYRLLQECDFGFVHQVLTFTRQHKKAASVFAIKFNTYLTGNLDILRRHGPVYLTKAEYERSLNELTDAYYVFLAQSLFQSKSRAFWQYHRQHLANLGFSLSIPRLLGAASLRIARVMLHPLEVARTVVVSWWVALSQILP